MIEYIWFFPYSEKISGAKPFSCQFCGRAFRQRSQQLGHESTHASGPLSMGAHLPHASSHHIKFESTKFVPSFVVVNFTKCVRIIAR